MRIHFSKGEIISELSFPLPCIVCNKKLEPAIRGDEQSTQPLNALAFVGHGAYGSEFDPMDGRLSLLINVCDECLSIKGKEGSVVMVTQARPTLPAPTFEAYKA